MNGRRERKRRQKEQPHNASGKTVKNTANACEMGAGSYLFHSGGRPSGHERLHGPPVREPARMSTQDVSTASSNPLPNPSPGSSTAAAPDNPWRIMDPVRGRIRFAMGLACASTALSMLSLCF